MVEKFSDFESAKYLDKEGVFTFTVKDAEVKDSSKGKFYFTFNFIKCNSIFTKCIN